MNEKSGPTNRQKVTRSLAPAPSLSAYAVAVTTVACAVIATLGLGSTVKYTPTLFFCSVILSSWFGGVWVGVFAGMLSAIALDYYFIPPIYALGISMEEAPDMVAFVASALFVSWLGGRQTRGNARRKLWGKRGESTPERIPEHWLNSQPPEPQYRDATLLDRKRASPLQSPFPCSWKESAFLRQGDYWTIQYQGQIAHLRATRGLHCLASLLEHPGREFHVTELIAGVSAIDNLPGDASVRVRDAGPILDARAKAAYAQRVADLREELEDAERLNDSTRAGKIRQEIDSIADQMAIAVGLSGRDRKAASQAERARSTVTKRIKASIDKIARAMPTLGRHLAVTIRTGYFCSYSPNPDRFVGWKVRP
jgi:Domain of unknown function (DUF4118)